MFHYVLFNVQFRPSQRKKNSDSPPKKNDDVLIEHGGLPQVLPLPLKVDFFFGGQVEGTIVRYSYSLSIVMGPLLHG